MALSPFRGFLWSCVLGYDVKWPRCQDRSAQAAFTNETYMPRLAAVFAVLVGTGATGKAGVYTKGVFVNSSE